MDRKIDNKRTIRLCHLAEKSDFKVGDTITSRELIGVMGSTGQSTGPHVHSDIVKGWHDWCYRQIDITNGALEADLDEFPYFIGDDWMFNAEILVTTFPHDPRYIINGVWKDHQGYDFCPIDRKTTLSHYGIHWPRGKKHDGVVLRNEYSEGYGFHLNIGYRK